MSDRTLRAAMALLEKENAELRQKLRDCQVRVDTLFELAARLREPSAEAKPTAGRVSQAVRQRLAQFTIKQHAALQMLLRGASNTEIAQRFAVTESTAKTILRGIMRRLDVRTRTQAICVAQPVVTSLTPQEYQSPTGIPREWDEKYDSNHPVSIAVRMKRGSGRRRLHLDANSPRTG